MRADPIMSCTGIVKSFGGVHALSGVALDIRAGEIHALIGENGAGKSTLIKILSGIHRPDSGEILFDGQPVALGSIDAAKRLRISVIHQELSVVTALTASENVFLGKELLKKGPVPRLDKAAMERQTKTLLESLGVDIPTRVPAKELSIAQRQLIEIAKALGDDARVLILDEPTTALTTEEVDALFRVLHTLRENGVAILYVSHRLEEIYRISDRITVFRDGQLAGSRRTADLPQEELIAMMVGRDLTDLYPKKNLARGEVVLKVQNLRCKGSEEKISFALHKGELLGIGGLVGAGRTELVRTIAGIDRADGGEILLCGERLRLRSVRDAIDNGILLVPEDRKRTGLLTELSIQLNTTLPTLAKWRRLCQINRALEAEKVDEVRRKLAIKMPSPTAKVSALSGGNQQKVAIGKWLLVDNIRVLILDEPTRGVDVGAKAEIYKIMELLLEEGASILMVSSDLPELLAMSDRILVMREGRMMGELDAGTNEEEIMALATGGKKHA